MTPPEAPADRRHLLATLVVVAACAVTLNAMGRVWWCQVGDWMPWSFDVWSAHNSQHLLDPYTFTHVLHGVAYYGILWVLVKKWTTRWTRGVVALSLEAAWEVAENTPMVIEKYRESTMSLDYFGDSIGNSMADLVACTAGYLFAAAVPAWASFVGFGVVEAVLLLTIRDSLIVNVIMLVWPVEAIKQWQMQGMPGS